MQQLPQHAQRAVHAGQSPTALWLGHAWMTEQKLLLQLPLLPPLHPKPSSLYALEV